MNRLDGLKEVIKAAAEKSIASLSETSILRGFSALRIPLIAFLAPRVLKLDETGVEVEIPLSYRSRNHLGSMYFGALATGADLAVGYLAFREIQKSGKKVSFVFQSFRAEFLKRAEGDVVFRFVDVERVRNQVAQTIASGERISEEFEVLALTSMVGRDEIVAKFWLTLSMKASKKNNQQAG